MSAAEIFEIPVGDGEVRVAVWSSTDVGAVRRVNEDSMLARPPFFGVADGMGGHLFGDRASQTTVAAIAEAVGAALIAEPQEIIAAIGAANDAVRRITDWGATTRSLSGTTLTGLALVTSDGGRSAHWMIVNVGDSRVYAHRDGMLQQLTVDHSVVQELVDAGVITPEFAAIHPDRNVVTRALGAADRVDADVWLLPAHGQQSFVLCSDGLTKELDDARIAAVVEDSRDRGVDPADALVRAAVEAGGTDNVTVLMLDAETVDADPYDSLTKDRSGFDVDASRLEDTLPRR